MTIKICAFCEVGECKKCSDGFLRRCYCKHEKIMEIVPPVHTCIECQISFIEGDIVYTVHPISGLVHYQEHIFPHGQSPFGNDIINACKDKHTEPHIHEKCVKKWKKRVKPTTEGLDSLQKLNYNMATGYYDDEPSWIHRMLPWRK